VTFNGYATVDIRGLIIITNVTRNIIVYSYADLESPYSLGGTASTNVVTLEYDTTKMAAADNLQIYYDDVAADSDFFGGVGQDKRFDWSGSDLIYMGQNATAGASEDNTEWRVSKFTWDGSGNPIRIEGPLIGSWTGRAALGWT
jgi:YD repeat-containing protein